MAAKLEQRPTWRKDSRKEFRKGKLYLLPPCKKDLIIIELYILQGVFSSESQIFTQINTSKATAYNTSRNRIRKLKKPG